MVISKGNVNVRTNRAAQDPNPLPPWRHAGVRSVKILSSCDADMRGGTLPVAKKKILAGSSDLKAKEASGDVLKGSGKSNNIVNTRRTALADISNTNMSLSKNETRDGSKSMIPLVQRSAIVKVAPKRSSTEKVRDSMAQGFSGRLEVGARHSEASSGCWKTNVKTTAPKFSIASGRKNATNALLTRKSLPVLRRVDHVEPENIKKNSSDTKKSKEITGLPVKAKVGRKVVSRTNNANDYILKNRASDGCKQMAKNEGNKDSRASFRKSMRPASRRSVKAPNPQMSIESVGITIPKRSAHIALGTANNEEVSSSMVKMSVKDDSGHTRRVETAFDVKNSPDIKTLEISSKQSQRRRSFTAMIMTRSKLLKNSGVTMEEKLPNIDDVHNHLEVAEYVDDIYQYYWAAEAQNASLEGYLSVQTEISPHMRGILINWLIEVHLRFDLMQETLYLMVTLLDRCLSLVTVKKNEMQLVGLSALLVASKYEDYWHPRIKDLISISAESYERDQVLRMERLILNKLKFRVNAPTLYVFMIRFLKAAQSSRKLEHLAFYLIELCLVEYEALKFKPSILCAAAIFVAKCTLQISPPWTPLLVKHTRYEVSKIRVCAEMILKFHKSARKRQLSVTYEKYMRPEFDGVARMKPLDKLHQ